MDRACGVMVPGFPLPVLGLAGGDTPLAVPVFHNSMFSRTAAVNGPGQNAAEQRRVTVLGLVGEDGRSDPSDLHDARRVYFVEPSWPQQCQLHSQLRAYVR